MAKYCATTFILALFLKTTVAVSADKSGVSPNSISLPSGPGSVEGLGEAFQPTLNTGTAKYGLALRLPPGTAGHAPALTLRYEGGSGNGPIGFGWSLPVPYIQRQCDKGIPRYVDVDNQVDEDRDGDLDEHDELDVFINELKEELVPQASGHYFSRNEGAFIRYRFVPAAVLSPSPSHARAGYWEGTLPNGIRLEFGRTPAARVQDVENTNRVFRWLLERSIDPHGNTILFAYRSFPSTSDQNQKYLAAIRYGPGAPPWASFHFVTLGYETRPDWFEDGRPGFVLRTGRRLTEITMGTQGPSLPGHQTGDFDGDGHMDNLVRQYQLTYLPYDGTNSFWSLLASVRLLGADGTNALPAATFGYAVCRPPELVSAAGREAVGGNEPPFVMDNPLVDLADLNGDGLPDILKTEVGGAHSAYLNLGEQINNGIRTVRWGTAQEVASSDGLAWNVNLQSVGDVAHLADMDGDGVADLAYKSAVGDVYYFANRASLGWGPRQTMSIQDSAPPSPFGLPDVRSADLDFDKRIDIVQSLPVGDGVEYRIWFNLGQGRFARSLTVAMEPGHLFSQPGVHLVDFNGDRVPDVVRVRPGGVSMAAGLGYGRFASPVIVALPDPGLDDTQAAAARLQDITGDGLADLVLERAEPGRLWCWLNRGNYSFGPRILVTGMPTGSGSHPAVRWADLNGNGTTDLVYADSLSSPRLVSVDLGELLGCIPGHNVLVTISNGIGRATSLEYQPSTRFALEDAAAGRPWPNVMPFPVLVVSKVTTADSLGDEYVTHFRYHDGYYDGVEKEFRGFARVEQIDVGDTTAPTLVTESIFDTGREYETLKGSLLRRIARQADGGVFHEEITTWTHPPRTLMTGVNGQPVQYVHPIATVRRVRELGQGEERRLESEFAYDEFGNRTRHADFGIVVNGDRSAFNDERVTAVEYAVNTSEWLLRFPSRTEVQDEHGIALSRTEIFYDDPAFGGANFGQVIRGDATMTRRWINADGAGTFVPTARTHYDVFGNAVRSLDPLALAPAGNPDPTKGHWREFAYDADFHTYSVKETIHIGGGRAPLVVQAEHDPGFGTVVRSIEFNGHETSYLYDAFARLTRIIRPGDTAAFPTAEHDYVLGLSIGHGHVVNYVETRSLDQLPGSAGGTKRDHYFIVRQFADGLGRRRMVRTEAEAAPGKAAPRVVVQGAARYNARGTLASVMNPFFTTLAATNLDELLAFEDITAADWRGQFHEAGESQSLGLAEAHQTQLTYDALLRGCETINPDGTRRRILHEPLVDVAFDENDLDPSSPHFNTPAVHHFDGLARLIRSDEIARLNADGTPGPLSVWNTRFEYDLNDCVTGIIDAQGNRKRMEYDGLQRITFMDDPDAGVRHYTYDAASNLRETWDARNQRTTYTYDGANRLLSEDYHDDASEHSSGHAYDPGQDITPDNRPDVAYFYDAAQPSVDTGDGTTDTAANTMGRLAYVWDLSGEEHTSYDYRGRIAWSIKRVRDPAGNTFLHRPGSSTPLVSYQTRHAYDSLDRLVRLVYPDHDEVDYRYNERNQLHSIGGDVAGALFTVVDYLPSDRPAAAQYGNGVRTHQGYDRRLRLQSIRTVPPAGPELLSLHYQFDPGSNFRAIHDRRSAEVIPEGDPRRNTQQFEYDDLYRLTRVEYPLTEPSMTPGPGPAPGMDSVPGAGEIRYRYDRIGNLIAQTSNLGHLEHGIAVTELGEMQYGGPAGTTNRLGRGTTSPGPHALSAIRKPGTSPRDFLYDANGNMTVQDGLSCTWDFKDRLIIAEDTQMRAEYAYDYADRRIVKSVTPKPAAGIPANPPNQVTLYINRAFEVRDRDQPTKYVWNGGARVARVTGTLSSRDRVQRLRLFPGWNLISLAVPTPASAPWLHGTNAHRWDPVAGEFRPLNATDTLPAGTVLWVHAMTGSRPEVKGAYKEPAAWTVPAGGTFLGVGLEEADSASTLPEEAVAWIFGAETQAWRARFGHDTPLADENMPTPGLAPGEAVFVRPNTPGLTGAPDPATRIHYYHPDHLGSAAVITDGAGRLVEERAYYPFGVERHRHQAISRQRGYGFMQKERDPETRQHYFEARYLAGALQRFTSVDKLYAAPFALDAERFRAFARSPQMLNLYACALNNPIRYSDPSGHDPDDETKVASESVWGGIKAVIWSWGDSTEKVVSEDKTFWGPYGGTSKYKTSKAGAELSTDGFEGGMEAALSKDEILKGHKGDLKGSHIKGGLDFETGVMEAKVKAGPEGIGGNVGGKIFAVKGYVSGCYGVCLGAAVEAGPKFEGGVNLGKKVELKAPLISVSITVGLEDGTAQKAVDFAKSTYESGSDLIDTGTEYAADAWNYLTDW